MDANGSVAFAIDDKPRLIQSRMKLQMLQGDRIAKQFWGDICAKLLQNTRFALPDITAFDRGTNRLPAHQARFILCLHAFVFTSAWPGVHAF